MISEFFEHMMAFVFILIVMCVAIALVILVMMCLSESLTLLSEAFGGVTSG